MNSFITRAFVPALLLVLVVPALAGDKLFAEMQAIYNKEASALKAKDIAAFGKYYAANYVEFRAGKRTGRKAFLAGVGQSLRDAKSFTSTITVLSATEKQGGVVAKYRFVYDITQVDPKGKAHHITGVEEGTESWKRSGSGYVCTQTKITKDEAKFDGKPVKSPGM